MRSTFFALGVIMKIRLPNYLVTTCSVTSLVILSQCFALSSSNDSAQGTSNRGWVGFQKSCSMCHGVRQGETKVGPTLYIILKSGSGRSEKMVRQTIENGKGTMPAYKDKLSQHDMDDLIKYLETL